MVWKGGELTRSVRMTKGVTMRNARIRKVEEMLATHESA